MSHLKTQMDLLARHLLSSKIEMIKAVDAQGTISVIVDAEANYSGKLLSSPSMSKAMEKEVSVDESEARNPVESEKVDGFVDMSKKEDDKKEEVFMAVIKRLTVTVPLMEALEQMPSYAKFMKDLRRKKRKKKPDPGVFTILCTMGSIKFTRALCDLGESINLMPFEIYKNLGLRDPTLTTMHLVKVERSVMLPVGVLHDVPVKVDNFILPADFVILDCDVDFEVPIILGRPLLSTGRVLVDMDLTELMFRYEKRRPDLKCNLLQSS
ncbi:uncharacterized protein LOC124888956 [Capsicum annuum]|uniref:uncharacterized protein LOC124888956 n=1 Tax=Capsicum annuum TaxID=4072 RepID=UPI001FB09E49|nr:uncharacterized protein LOC124888956 [Capsicum annuum]